LTLRARIERQFPKLAPIRIQHLSQGWDNFVFRVNDTLVFRFPRRQIAVVLLKHEAAFLPYLVNRVPLMIPSRSLVHFRSEL